ncbi:class I SAM-dependent methyltransferase [Ideonella sp. A 288]|uniref:N5-glutamine methyltransferase family protein n=1 Tax=Ideonella sp. A 288 TaxID=1962181 RepID=UPI000B4ACB75|nr:class I SAM-dependent methyltransferase [Ideonella sp. A 288]
MTDDAPQLRWTDEQGQVHPVRWRSLAGHPPPVRVRVVGDDLGADEALRLARDGIGLLWCGDYQNARHLMQAMGRRLDARNARHAKPAADQKSAFLSHRRDQALRARLLGALLLPFDADHGVPLRRAPDLRAAGLEAHGPVEEHYVSSLRELLGIVGAHEWRKKGVAVEALGAAIHPHHGVFSPVRGEYVDLVARTPLPTSAARDGAFDIGTGTGVLAAVLAKRGLRVMATDQDPRALACAADNLARLKLARSVTLLAADLFPPGRAGLVVCNPPWVPAPTHSPLEAAVYDPDSRMLRGFLAGLAEHLGPGGEGWLLLSDLAEHLGLRSRDELLGWITQAGLRVVTRHDIRPRHSRAADASDPLHAARAAEVTSLWRLGAA